LRRAGPWVLQKPASLTALSQPSWEHSLRLAPWVTQTPPWTTRLEQLGAEHLRRTRFGLLEEEEEAEEASALGLVEDFRAMVEAVKVKDMGGNEWRSFMGGYMTVQISRSGNLWPLQTWIEARTRMLG